MSSNERDVVRTPTGSHSKRSAQANPHPLTLFICLSFLKGVVMPYRYVEPKKYGFWRFIFDVCMVCITCGFWLIWIFVREMRRQR
jgi:hypothetical protein